MGLLVGIGCVHRPRVDALPPSGSEPVVQPEASERWAWQPGPGLPEPRSNNAVVSVQVQGRWTGFSMLGLGPGRTHADIALEAWMLPRGGAWQRSPGVPGERGRLAATAQAVGGKVYLFGGYTVAADGAEVSTPHVDVYDPVTRRWSRAAAMPRPVDDAVSGVWRDSIIVVSGWHQRDNVRDVQRFDPATDAWTSLPPILGTPVFGHAGGVVDDALVYCDGVGVDRTREQPFFAVAQCHGLDLAAGDRSWRSLPHHGRATRYRAAAGALPSRGWMVFAGGTGRPYNYDGTGYDGVPAEARDEVFAWDVDAATWVDLPPLPQASMDHRGLIRVDDGLAIVGGMHDGGEVHPDVWVLRSIDR